jgi:hypothetical protein
MLGVRHHLLVALAALAWLCAAPSVRASSIHEVNNSPAKAFVLPVGQMVVEDDLNGNSGRPDTLLAQFDPTYGSLLMPGVPTPGVGNGGGSQLLGVPLRANGSAYFSVTGAPDTAFEGDHIQFGKYSVSYQVHNAGHQLVKESTQFEWVTPGFIDNLWLNPDISRPNWTGYTADVTVNNIVGPGSGDSLDFFLFSGLAANQPFVAEILNPGFNSLIGWYNNSNVLLASGNPTVSGVADSMGRAKIGVTGQGDVAFEGAHAETGTYMLAIVPEPAGVVTLGIGTSLVCLFWKFRRSPRRGAGGPRLRDGFRRPKNQKASTIRRRVRLFRA